MQIANVRLVVTATLRTYYGIMLPISEKVNNVEFPILQCFNVNIKLQFKFWI